MDNDINRIERVDKNKRCMYIHDEENKYCYFFRTTSK